MSRDDHYQVLGVPPTASLEQIKAAYRRQAVKHHPDRNPESAKASAEFRRCSEAYQVLSDPRRRAAYDNRLDGRSVPELAREFLDDLLGTRVKRKRPGRDVRFDLELPLREAARGATAARRPACGRAACRRRGSDPRARSAARARPRAGSRRPSRPRRATSPRRACRARGARSGGTRNPRPDPSPRRRSTRARPRRCPSRRRSSRARGRPARRTRRRGPRRSRRRHAGA